MGSCASHTRVSHAISHALEPTEEGVHALLLCQVRLFYQVTCRNAADDVATLMVAACDIISAHDTPALPITGVSLPSYMYDHHCFHTNVAKSGSRVTVTCASYHCSVLFQSTYSNLQDVVVSFSGSVLTYVSTSSQGYTTQSLSQRTSKTTDVAPHTGMEQPTSAKSGSVHVESHSHYACRTTQESITKHDLINAYSSQCL